MSTETTLINWEHESTTSTFNWADEMDEIESQDASIATIEDSQPSDENSSPLSSSSSDNEGGSSPNDRSPQTESFADRIPRSESHNTLPRSASNQKLSKSSELSVKEEIPFPTVAPFVAFVSNVHSDCTQRDIMMFFEPTCGTPKSVKIILSKDNGLPRGFCYVEFVDAASLRAAIDSDGSALMSQSLHIVVADQKKEKPARKVAGSSRRNETREHHDTKGRHRQDSASSYSKGKADNSSWSKVRRDDHKSQPARSTSSNQTSHADKESYTKHSMLRKSSDMKYVPVAKKDVLPNNMFLALAHDDM